MTTILLDGFASVPVPVPTTEELAKELRPILAEEKAITDEQVSQNQAVRVTIKRGDDRRVVITCNHPVPSVELIIIHLSPEHRKKIKKHSYWSIENHIANEEAGIPFQAWADAISSAIMQKLTNEQGASSELQFAAQPCYMSYGNTLFKMSPIAMIPQTKALATARKKIRDVAELEAKQLLESVKVSANTMLAAATKTKMDADAYKQKVEREIGKMPPKWLFEIGYPIMFNSYSNRWEVQVEINFKITHLDLGYLSFSGFADKKFTWNAEPMEARKIRLWIPLNDKDGTYQATSIHVDQHDPRLPHIHHSSGCMSLASGPKKITGAGDLLRLAEALEFVHSRVQLDSMYVHAADLIPAFQKAFPLVLFAAMKESGADGAIKLAKKTLADAEKAKKDAEEARKRGEAEVAAKLEKEIWTVETVNRKEEESTTWQA